MEEEVERAKDFASTHKSQPNDSPLRQFVVTEANNAVRERRSVDSFIELISILCKDEDKTFANLDIDFPRLVVDALWVLDTERELYTDNSSGVDLAKLQRSLAQIVKTTTASVLSCLSLHTSRICPTFFMPTTSAMDSAILMGPFSA
jgi:hypothetical protein